MESPQIAEKSNLQLLDQTFKSQKENSYLLRTEPLKNRLVKLKKLQNWIESNRDTIQHAVHSDFKKPKTEVDISEIFPIISELKHTISHLKSWAKPKKVDAPISYLGTTSYVQYEPKGVCLVISPWNYPFSLCLGPMISAIAAGNTVMIKPSEMTPHTSALIDTMVGELFEEKDVAVFQGGVDVSKALLEKPFDHIFFTGSPAVGKIVMSAASNHLSSITLELGGKSPTIIDKSASISDTAEKVAWGKFLNCGQTCVAPDYLLIEESIKDKFIETLKTFIQKQFDSKLKGFDKSPDYTRIVNSKHYKRISHLIEDALDSGANLEMGGNLNSEDNFIPPTILSNVSPNALMMEEEIFGPVLPVVTYKNIDEAIEIINSKPKPLALYFFGKNKSNRKKVLTQTSSGGACINDCVLQFSHTNLPFGGVNNSGIGKSHGKYGFLSFSNEKGVLKQRIGLTGIKSLYPPYTNKVKMMVKAMLKFL